MQLYRRVVGSQRESQILGMASNLKGIFSISAEQRVRCRSLCKYKILLNPCSPDGGSASALQVPQEETLEKYGSAC